MKYTGVCLLPTLSFDEDGAHNAARYESLSSWLKGSKCGRASCCFKKNMLYFVEKKCAIMPADLNILHILQLQSHTAALFEILVHGLLWAADSCMRVSCFPVFEKVESNRKGVFRSWSRALNENCLKKGSNKNSALGYCKIFRHPIFSLCARSVKRTEITLTSLLD